MLHRGHTLGIPGDWIPRIIAAPVPIAPFLFAAGALQYPAAKFLLALPIGRISLYIILSYLGGRFGTQVTSSIVAHGGPVTVGIVLAPVAAAALIYYIRGP